MDFIPTKKGISLGIFFAAALQTLSTQAVTAGIKLEPNLAFPFDWNLNATTPAIAISANRQSDSAENKLVTVSSDAISGTETVSVALDGDLNLAMLRLYSGSDSLREFTLDQLARGAVILRKSGYNVITLKSRNLDTRSGGQMDLIYLKNALLDNYGTFHMELLRSGDQWMLQTNGKSGRRPFTTMFLKAKVEFGEVIGIESVSVK